jgi:ATP-binding cassette, subfamily B, bacterial
MAFLFLVNLLVQPVQTLVETLDSAQAAGAGVRRVIGGVGHAGRPGGPGEAGSTCPNGRSMWSSGDCRSRYPTGDRVLEDVNVDIAPGRRVAVVGQTGSGKTTFAKAGGATPRSE